MNDKDEEIVRLCRVIASDKSAIASLEEEVEALQDVVDKQNDLIETLWELYTLER